MSLAPSPSGDLTLGHVLRAAGIEDLDAEHRQHFRFSILRVFDPSATTSEVDAAEAHSKRALLSREHGLNRN